MIRSRGDKITAFIEKYCIVPEGMLVGKKIVLADFQKDFIHAVYDNPHPDGTAMGILSIARKNSKTATIACLLLAHIAGPEAVLNSRIISGARSKEQAAEIYNYASKMVMMSPELSELVRIVPSGKRLIGLAKNVEYQAISAEGKTAHGKSPILAILDEVGQVRGPQDDFIDAITTAQGAYDHPLLLAISTQAATDADLLSIWIDDAKKSSDPSIVCHVYEAPKECEIMDREAWYAANPALGKFLNLTKFEQMAEKASRMPSFESTFRNLHLNQRISTVNPFMSKNVWESCGGLPESLEGCKTYGGLDLSSRNDLTAFVLVGVIDGVIQIHPYFWCPEIGLDERCKRDRVEYDVWVREGYLRTTPGATVDYAFVVQEIMEICEGTDLQAIAFDRWRIQMLKREAEILGIELPLIEHGQGFKDMSPALDTLEAEALNSRMRHGMHPVLTMCAANAVISKDPAGNRKLDKSKATGRIDGMQALAMALSAANGELIDSGDMDGFFAEPIIA